MKREFLPPAARLSLALFLYSGLVYAQPGAQSLPNLSKQITPLAPTSARFEPMNPGLADNPTWLAGQAVTTVVSPDHKTLLALTSGYNLVNYTGGSNVGNQNNPDSNEYVFIYDISTHTPIKKQVVQIPNTYNGIVFDPSGTAFYVSGGVDDKIHIIAMDATGVWGERAGNPALALGHKSTGNGLLVQPCAAGLAISKDGQTLIVANYYNDSITIFNGGYGLWKKSAELDLRPGRSNPAQAGTPGGEYPFWVAVSGNGSSATAYVSSIRDREIDVVSLAGTPSVTARIKVKGQPNKMTLNAAQTLLYVVEDETDTVDVVDTTKNAIVETIPVIAPPSTLPSALAQLTGANPNSATLSPDETQLYVTNGNMNAIAVVALGGNNSGDQVVGLIPTGWYPNSVSLSGDGKMLYVVNGKSPTGPNPGNCHGTTSALTQTCAGTNQYDLQLLKAGFQSFPVPTSAQLATLTTQVATNNRLSNTESANDAAVMSAVRAGVQHVIFIIKENRTYDQVLGDLPVGNGDPDLTEWGASITPNLHNLALTFTTLDNFYDSSEVSMDGWPYTTSARAPDVVERQVTVNYAGRGLTNDSEGTNRNVNVAYPTIAQRQAALALYPPDPDLLPGQTDVAAPDGPNNEVNTGYLWDSALRAGLTVRNYGFFLDLARYQAIPGIQLPLTTNPAASGTVVAFPTSASLAPLTDPYFRGFDNNFPDYFRYTEWAREFDANYASGGLPALSLVRLMHDHTGNFSTAINGVNTPELQEADNDYAVGLLVQKIANSQYANNTLIFIIEDDSQDGADHVDSHRSIAFVAGAYVKQGALVSTQYNTIDFVRTIEEVLGLSPLNINDALANPMADIFNTTPSTWSFTATPSAMLYNTTLPLPAKPTALRVPKPTHNAKYWARATKGMDFSAEDRIDFAKYNLVLWKGMMGNKPYPATPSKIDLRPNREELLKRYKQSTGTE